MMETRDTRLQQFLRILRTGYRQVDAPTPDIHRQYDVMRAVRHLGPLNATPDPLEFMNQMTWRFASAASVCILVASAYVAFVGLNPETGVLRQFFENPVGFLLMQAIGGF